MIQITITMKTTPSHLEKLEVRRYRGQPTSYLRKKKMIRDHEETVLSLSTEKIENR